MSVIVDTSVWVDHFRTADATLAALLDGGAVTMHPFVVGELALGNLNDRDRVIAALSALPGVQPVAHDRWLALVDKLAIAGTGLGFVDAHLLASARETGLRLLTRDRRLHARACKLGLAWTG